MLATEFGVLREQHTEPTLQPLNVAIAKRTGVLISEYRLTLSLQEVMVKQSHCPPRVFPPVTQRKPGTGRVAFRCCFHSYLWLWYRKRSMRKHKIYREKELWSSGKCFLAVTVPDGWCWGLCHIRFAVTGRSQTITH